MKRAPAAREDAEARLRALPALLPAAIAWAEACAGGATKTGTPLSLSEQELAQTVGVARPELVRVEAVGRMPLPGDGALQSAAIEAGLLGPDAVGLTLGYAIFIRRGYLTRRLLSHELRHVHQYEQHGSIAAFLPVYLRQVIELGYHAASFEMDARAHELGDH